MQTVNDQQAPRAGNPACDTVICLTTFNRVDCARINLELIRLNYANRWTVVHACSAPGFEPYLTDLHVPVEPIPKLHYGAMSLIKTAIKSAVDAFNPKFIVHLEADTWILDEGVIIRYLEAMQADPRLLLCTSRWDEDSILTGNHMRWGRHRPIWLRRLLSRALRAAGSEYGLTERESLSLQFFVMRNDPAMLDCIMGLEPQLPRDLEAVFYDRFMARFGVENLLFMREREPIHPDNRFVCKALALHSEHWPAAHTSEDPRPREHPQFVDPALPGKREALMNAGRTWQGPHLCRLLESIDTSYYNVGARRY